MRGIGILPGRRPQYIDHLVPLCQIMDIPLLVTDPAMGDLVRRYYPPMEIIEWEPEDYVLDPVLAPYDTFVYVNFSRTGNGVFQFHEYLARKKARSVISLHGQPDKFGSVYWLEKLADEDIVLAYGPRLVDLLKEKAIGKTPIITGNYRQVFYKAHETFFDSRLFLEKKGESLLYAPTWSSKEKTSELRVNYSSFFEVYRSVFELSHTHQLWVKLHPFMAKMWPSEIEEIKEQYPHIPFLDDIPLVFPLLKKVDIYLGDYSSIGYDFLYFDRPLFFLQTNEKTLLHSCGRTIKMQELKNLPPSLGFDRKRVYNAVFGQDRELSDLKMEIEHALSR